MNCGRLYHLNNFKFDIPNVLQTFSLLPEHNILFKQENKNVSLVIISVSVVGAVGSTLNARDYCCSGGVLSTAAGWL